MTAYLLDAGAVITLEAAVDFVGGGFNVTQTLAVNLLGIGSQPRDCEHLLVFLHALLEFSKEHAESCWESAEWQRG